MNPDACKTGALYEIRSALLAEAPALILFPEILFQQLHNRLRWSAGVEVAAALGKGRALREHLSRAWLEMLIERGGITREHSLLARFAGECTCVAPCEGSGWTVVAGSLDGDMRLFDSSGCSQSFLTAIHGPGISCCAVQGDLVASGDLDGRLCLSSAAGLRTLWECQVSRRALTACAFAASSDVIACTADGVIGVFDEHGAERRRWQAHEGEVLDCDADPASLRLLTVGADGSARVWSLTDGTLEREMTSDAGPAYACALARGGSTAIWAAEPTADAGDLRPEAGRLMIWPLDILDGPEEYATPAVALALSVNPATQGMVVGDLTGRITVFESPGGAKTDSFRAHQGWVNDCAWLPDGRTLVTSGADGALALWASGDTTSHPDLEGHRAGIDSCAFSPDGAHLCTAGNDGTLFIWSTDTWEIKRRITGPAVSPALATCAVDATGHLVAATAFDGSVTVWRLLDGNLEARFECIGRSAYGLAFDASGTLLAAGYDDGGVRLWDIAAGGLRAELKGHSGEVYGCAFCPSKRFAGLLVTTGADTTVRFWNATQGKEFRASKIHSGPVMTVSFDTPGDRFITASFDGTAAVWRTGSESPFRAIKRHTGLVRAAAFAGASLVATASWDRTLRLTEVETGRQVAVYAADADLLCCAADRSGVLLAAGDDWSGRPHVFAFRSYGGEESG